MKRKPIEFIILSVFLAAVAISFPIQVMIQYQHLPYDFSAILSKITTLNMIVIGACLVSSFLTYHASAKVILFGPSLIFLVFWNNYRFSEVSANFSAASATMGSLCFAAVSLILFRKEPLTILKKQYLRS